MAEFKKYQHVERLGSEEVAGIEVGTCVIMPKIDGTNSSIWMKDDGTLGFGSRNRELTLENDNAGFMAAMINSERIKQFFEAHPDVRLYGEWLVPHTIKNYENSAWRKFYVFDVTIDTEDGEIEYVPFDVYQPWLDALRIDYIKPLAIVTNPSVLDFYDYLEKNKWLMTEGVGEGVVIHNYGFRNKYGRQTWAKIVNAEFKQKHRSFKDKTDIATIELLEAQIIDKYVTDALVDKEYSKIVTESNGWSSKYIPRLLNTVFHCLITEEMWNIIKDYKNPKIDFKVLRALCIDKIKEVKKEIFM